MTAHRCFLLAGMWLALQPPRAAAQSSSGTARIAEILHRTVAAGLVPGAVVLVMRDNRIIVYDAAGFHDIATRRPMRRDALFRIASMTKPITAAAIMMLVEEGQIRLNDRVSRYIPEFAAVRVLAPNTSDTSSDSLPTVPAARPVTVRDLLTHRSGIVYGFRDRGPIGATLRHRGIGEGAGPDTGTVADMIARLVTVPLKFQPGASWDYGLSYDVLGRVVEIVSGGTLEEFLETRMFRPLRMTDTHFSVPPAKWQRIPTAYSIDGDATEHFRMRPMEDPELFPIGLTLAPGRYRRLESQRYQSGGVGLYSTAADYARFLLCLLNGGELEGYRLLSPASVRLMTVSHTGDLDPRLVGPGAGFGLGFRVITDIGQWGMHASQGAFGWDGAYGTDFLVDPSERLIVVTMMQLFPRRGVTLALDLRTSAYQTMARRTVSR